MLYWSADTTYVQAFAEAKEEACELLQAEARRRAVDGVDLPLLYKGRASLLKRGTPTPC